MRTLLACFLLPIAAAAVPVRLVHSGYVVDGADAPRSGTLALSFGLHGESSGGTASWTTTCSATAAGGYFAVTLGAGGCGALDSADVAGTRWLEISIDGVTLEPRQRVDPVPVAVNADRLAGQSIGDLDARYAKLAASDPTSGGTAQVGHLHLSGTVRAGAFAGSGAALTGVNAARVGGETLGDLDNRYVNLSQVDPLNPGGPGETGHLHVAGAVKAAKFLGDGAGVTNVDAASLGGQTLAQLDSRWARLGAVDPAGGTTTAQAGHVHVSGTVKAQRFIGTMQPFNAITITDSLALPLTGGTCDASTTGRLRATTGGLMVCENGVWSLVPSVAVAAHYPFDEGVSTTSYERKSGALAASLTGVTWLSTGVSGSCLQFAGNTVGSYAVIPAQVLHGLRDFTISYWLRKAGADTGAASAKHVLSFAASAASDDNALLVYGPTGTNGVWSHFVFRRSGTTLAMFRDGVRDDTYLYATPINPVPVNATGAGLVLNQDQDSPGGGFEATQAWGGDFDELKIIRYAVSDAQVAAGLP